MVGTYRSIARMVGGVVLVCLVGLFVVVAVPQIVGADESYVVLSDSMEPTIKAGGVVIVSETQPSTIDGGDVISFERPGGAGDGITPDKVTHRVVEVVERDDGRYFRTKGDANEEPDQHLVPAENLIGVVTLSIPLVGYLVNFVNSGLGLILFVVVPAVLLVVNEVWTLWVAATREGE